MSFSLASESGAHTGWTHFAWPIVRMLAEDFGWQPCGTQPPEGWDAQVEAVGEWQGSYTTNDGSFVTAQDALALAAALEFALVSADFEQRICSLHQFAERQMESQDCRFMLPVDVAGWRKDLEGFISFCKLGGFRLY